jgi:hypothetical protein
MFEDRGYLKKDIRGQTALVVSDVFFLHGWLQIGLRPGGHPSNHFLNEATKNGCPEDSIMHRLQESPVVP